MFYLAVYAVQLVGAFAVVAAVCGPTVVRHPGWSSTAVSASKSPLLAGGFSLLLLGMAGLPITAGFVAKFGVFSDAWASGQRWLVIVAVIASVIALAFYLRIIVAMYMDDAAEEQRSRVGPERWVLALAVGVTILGIFPSVASRSSRADALTLSLRTVLRRRSRGHLHDHRY